MTTRNLRHVPPCFSGQCGLCGTCCGQDAPSTSRDCIARSEVLSKFYQGSLTTDREEYMNKITQLMRREQGCLVHEKELLTGIIPTKFRVQEACFSGPSVYKKLETPHGAICDSPHCKMMYTSAPEYYHMSWFPQIPVYTRETDDGCQLCILCLKKQGKPVVPKL